MPAITTLSYAATSLFGRALVAFGRRLARRLMRLERAIEHRRALQVLARFDDRMLADIGLNRSDVRDAFSNPVWTDPTAMLRARALERRLARRGITHGLAPESEVAPPIVPKVDAAAVAEAKIAFCHNV